MLERIDAIDPRAYDRSRNRLDGAVTWLGPFLTHGIISTRTVATRVLAHHKPKDCYRLLFELAWREYFHREWQVRGPGIFENIREPQEGVKDDRPPSALLHASTGIDVVDQCVEDLIAEGTLHNHARMWVACIACNLSGTAWWEPARWLHYHLLDGDLASNTLSWQWIVGTFSNKRYLANQDNVNKFSGTVQRDTWLDLSYEEIATMSIPPELQQREHPDLPVRTPAQAIEVLAADHFDSELCLRSLWDLDPSGERAALPGIVFVDTALDRQWPMSENRWRFIRHWAEACNAPLVSGSVANLKARLATTTVHRREYPACFDWPGAPESREWLYPMPEEECRSFSKFWKKVRPAAGV